jgi:hypothetical protein
MKNESFSQTTIRETFIRKPLKRIGFGAAALAVMGGFAAEHGEVSHVPHSEQRTVASVVFNREEHKLSTTITKASSE